MNWITTGLPYANGALHAGHLYEWLLADTHARLSRLHGQPCAWVSGDDAHGVAVLRAAQREGVDPAAWTGDLTAQRRAQLAQWGLAIDVYGSTTEAAHHARVQAAYLKLRERGLIEDAPCLQYALGDGIPLFERDVRGRCAECGLAGQSLGSCDGCGVLLEPGGLVDPAHAATGAPVTVQTYHLAHFRWGEFRGAVRRYVEATRWAPGVGEKLLQDLAALPDLWCIERPGEYFGVPVPGKAGHFYVWFDALFGYGTFAAQAGVPDGVAPIHIIGKDILTFHALRWPAVCLALDEPTPRAILAHGHLVGKDRQKLSKSKGNAADPQELVAEFGLDVLRVDWLGASRGTPADLVCDSALLAQTRKSVASLLGNTYRRLHGLLKVRAPAAITDAGYAARLEGVRLAALAALETGNFSDWLQAGFEALRHLNQRIATEKWWEGGRESELQEGWGFLLALITALAPACPQTAGVVATKHLRGEWESLEKDDLFLVLPTRPE